jgi:transcriptional regulator with XRE-family HTH domain
MTNLREIFASNLKVKRQNYGITQAQLAEKVGVSTHHIAMIEIARHYPTLDLVERIANSLDIEIYELFTVKPTPETAIERLYKVVAKNIDQVVADAVEKALTDRYGKEEKR